MADKDVKELLEDARTSRSLRMRLSQDRSPEEMVESASKKGYSLSKRDARKILAGAYLTSNHISDSKQKRIVGGLSWDFLQSVEKELDGDYSMLSEAKSWERALDFYEYVYEGSDEE